MTNLIENSFIGFIMLFIFFLMLARLPWHVEPLQSYDVNSTYVIVNWFDSEKELQRALNDDTLAGLSECEMRPDFNTSFCELWLVRPTDSKDEYNFDTIGHEFYHAIVGDFHE